MSEYNWSPLQEACQKGDLETVKHLLLRREDTEETTNTTKKTLLHLAAENGHQEIVKYLIDKGADIEATTNEEETPLHLAAKKPRLQMVKLLVEEFQADKEARANYGWGPIHFAVVKNNLDMVQFLFEQNADIEAKTNEGETPLHLASKNGHLKIVEFLIEKEAVIETKNINGTTPIQLAAQNDQLSIIKCLLDKRANIEKNEIDDLKVLHLAVEKGDLDLVKILAERGAGLEAKITETNETLLHVAAKYGYTEIVEFLVEKGAEIEAKTKKTNETPLHLAAKCGYPEIVKFLVEKEKVADIEAKTSNGCTPLHLAAQWGHSIITEFLVEKGADIETKTSYGCTPLHLAAQWGHSIITEFLVEKGADIETKIKEANATPLYLAVQNGKLKVGKFLIEKGANTESKTHNDETILHWAVKEGILETVKFLVNNGADKEAKTKEDLTPLQLAVQKGHLEIVYFLVNNGADKEAKAKEDFTPLHLAAQNGHLEFVEFLVMEGANKEAETKKDLTPLYLAIQNDKFKIFEFLVRNTANIEKSQIDNLEMLHFAVRNGGIDTVQSLVRKRANIEAEETIGLYTPLHIAAEKGHHEIFEFLVDKGADLLAVTKTGQSVVHLACQNGHLEILESFEKLNKNKKRPEADASGKYPIHYAAENGFAFVVDFLVETMDYDANQKSKEGKTALQYALKHYEKDDQMTGKVRRKHNHVAQVLLQHCANFTPKDIALLEIIPGYQIQIHGQPLCSELINPNLQSMIMGGEFNAKIAIENTFDFHLGWADRRIVIFSPSNSLQDPEAKKSTDTNLAGKSNAAKYKESKAVLKEMKNLKKLENIYSYKLQELSASGLKVFFDVPFQESNHALYTGFGKKETQDQLWPKHKNAGNLTIIVQGKSIILLDEFHKNNDIDDRLCKLEAAKKIISDVLRIAFDYTIPDDSILKKLCFSKDDFEDFDDEKLPAIEKKAKKENVEILMLIGEQPSYRYFLHREEQGTSAGTSKSQLYASLCLNLRAQWKQGLDEKDVTEFQNVPYYNLKAQNKQDSEEKDVTEFQQNVIAGIVSLYFQSDFEMAEKTKQEAKLSRRMEMESGNILLQLYHHRLSFCPSVSISHSVQVALCQ
jgi:ankyrin repeat protein